MHVITRTRALRKYPLGTIFLEKDVPFVVTSRIDFPNGTFEYNLRELTPDEVTLWKVHGS